MATHPLAPGPEVIHAPHLTAQPIKLKRKPQEPKAAAAEKKPREPKPPAEKKKAGTEEAGGEPQGGGRSEGFGQGSGQHGQSPNVVHNHYYNPGNVIHGNVAEGAHVEGSGGAYVQGNVSGGNVAGRDINIGKKAGAGGAGGAAAEGAAGEAAAEGGAKSKTGAPRTRKPTSKATPASAPGAPTPITPAGALGVGPRGRAEAAEAARQGKPSQTFTQTGRPTPELGGSQSRPGGGAPAAARGKPLALGPAPVAPTTPKAPTPANALGAGPRGRAQQRASAQQSAPRTFAPEPPAAAKGSAKGPRKVDILDAPAAKLSKEELARARSDEPHELDDAPAAKAPTSKTNRPQILSDKPGEGLVIKGEVVKDDTAATAPVSKVEAPKKTGQRKTTPVTPPGTPPAAKSKRFAATRKTKNVSLSEGGTQAGEAGSLSEQMSRMEARREQGPSGTVNAVAAAAIALGRTKAPPSAARNPNLSPFAGEKHRTADDAVVMPKAASTPSSPASYTPIANIGVQTAAHAPGHPENPHKGQSLSPKGTQITLHPDTDATKVEEGHHVEVNGTKYKVGKAVGGSDLQRRYVAKDQG